MAHDTEEAQMTAAEEARKTRALQLAHDISDLATDLVERLEEAHEVIAADDLLHLVQERLVGAHPAYDIAYSAWATVYPGRALNKGMPLERVIARLFADAPKLEDAGGKPVPNQAPTVPDVQILLKAGSMLQGALSTTPEGTLRLGFTTQAKHPSGRLMEVFVEQFFEATDVAMIAVPRELPRIAGGKPSIIVAGS